MAATQTHTPESILAKFYKAERQYMTNPSDDKFDNMVSNFSTDLKIIQTPALPYGGVWNGIEGFRGWSQHMSKLFDMVDVQNPTIYKNGDSDRVMILGRLHLRVRESQKVLDDPFCQSVLVDCKAGVIKEIQPFYWDVKGLNDAVESV